MNKTTALELGKEPQYAKTKAGFVFNSDEDCWSISEGVNRRVFDFKKVKCNRALLHGMKGLIRFNLEVNSLTHSQNVFIELKKFINYSGKQIDIMDATAFMNYKASKSARTQGTLGTIAGGIRKWRDLGYEGVSDDLHILLKEIRLKGNQKGEAVRTMDPYKGPLSELEYQALYKALEDSHESRRISLREYCLARLFLTLGMRPIQYAGMKLRDLGLSQGVNGNDIYLVKVPRAKQRNISRTEFLERKVTEKFALQLFKHKIEVESQFPGFRSLEDLPFFPCKAGSVQDDELDGFKWHSTSAELGVELEEIVERLGVMSERTNDLLSVTSLRLRRTLGTRTAQEGHGVLIVAEVLDHSDIQNAGVYVEATPEIIERIDKAISLKMAPMAQAFKGVLITDESKAKRGNDPSSRIYAPKETGGFKPAGNCGTMNMCNLLAPIACYTCVNFQPWVDGPHEKVLESLLADRERLEKSSGQRIAAIEDQTILAVAHVVSLCQQQLGVGSNE